MRNIPGNPAWKALTAGILSFVTLGGITLITDKPDIEHDINNGQLKTISSRVFSVGRRTEN